MANKLQAPRDHDVIVRKRLMARRASTYAAYSHSVAPAKLYTRPLAGPHISSSERKIPQTRPGSTMTHYRSTRPITSFVDVTLPGLESQPLYNMKRFVQKIMLRVSSHYISIDSINYVLLCTVVHDLRQSGFEYKNGLIHENTPLVIRHCMAFAAVAVRAKDFHEIQLTMLYLGNPRYLHIRKLGASDRLCAVVIKSDNQSIVSCGCCPESMIGTLQQMMDFSLMKNPAFLLIGIANLFGMLGFYTPFVYLPAAAEAKGVDKTAATFLVSIIGITNTVGRVLSGLIADIPCVSALWVNNICIVASGLCVFLTPFATTYGSFCTIAVFFGFFVSPYIALTSIIIVDLLGLSQLTNAFGLLCIFRGVAGIIGPPLSGSIYDATQSYDVSFYVAGCLLFICAGLHIFVPCVQKYCTKDTIPIRYTTNLDYMQADPYLGTVDEEEEGPIVYEREGLGIILDVKAKDIEDVSDIKKNTIIESEDNEKDADKISAL
ncbi:unnamed protein product, partial [Meganyctiphanes norvegica]